MNPIPPRSTVQIARRLPPDAQLRRMRYDALQAEAWTRLLSEEERGRLANYDVEKRQREFLLGRVAARELLADVLGMGPEAVRLEVAEDGAVDVLGSDLHVSISHTGGEAVAVVARQAVGVDLERIAARPERLHRFLLTKTEQPLLHRLPMPKTDAFVLCWALKEAALKALRCGLRRSPKTLRLTDVRVGAGTARIDAREDGLLDAHFARDGQLWLVVAYKPDGES